MIFPQVKIPEQKLYREEIPAWMDFPEGGSEEEEEGDREEEEEGDSEEEDDEEEGKGDSDEKKMRRKMCMAWILSRKKILEFSEKLKMQEGKRTEERRGEIKRAWGEFSAEEVGWKVSEMDRLEEISLLIWMKKISELEQSDATMRQLQEAQEKGVQPNMELNKTNRNYLEFRNMWIAMHSCWGGVFENITTIRSIGYTNGPVPRYVYNYGPPDTLQIFSVKLDEIGDEGLCWPLHVFGLVAIRDSIDQYRNVIFNRKRDDFQTLTKEDPYLVLTGPTRSVVINNDSVPVTIEAELKVKSTDESEDKHLILAAAPLPSEFGSGSFILTGRFGKLNIALERITTCVEAAIFTRAIEGTWPAGFNGQLAAHTSGINHMKLVLAEFEGDVPVSDNGNVDQSRFVVSVELFGKLMVSYKAWRRGEMMQGEVAFKAEKKGRSYGTLIVGSCTLEILVAWSPIRPVCEELVSMAEMVFVE